MPLVVHYWADLQSGHGLRCYGNITRTRNVSEYMRVVALFLVSICVCVIVYLYVFLFHWLVKNYRRIIQNPLV